MNDNMKRRSFFKTIGAAAAIAAGQRVAAQEKPIQGFEKASTDRKASEGSSRRAKSITNNKNPVGRTTPQNKRGSSAKTRRTPARGRS